MTPAEKDRIYNLKVVVQETGIKPDTLRAWERRYGLPQPERTTGGHRIYSDYDIELIKWLIARQNDGMRINRAVELWKSLEEEGRVPIISTSQGYAVMDSHSSDIISGSNLDEMRQQWIQACLAFDERVAENILAQAFARYPLESVCIEVMQKGLSDIGSLWYAGNATVQQEHFTSALALRKLNTLIAAAPPSSLSNSILAACPPNEEHVFAPMLITLFLRNRGWNVIYLGADVPIANLEKAIDSTNVKLVILNATMLYTAANLYEVGMYLRSRNKVFAYGGNIFTQLPEITHRIPGYYLGEQLDKVVLNVESLISSTPILSKIESLSNNDAQAINQLMDNQFNIEAFINEVFVSNDVDSSTLEIVNEYMGKNILAALKLGNIEYLKPEIDWLDSLIKNHAFSTGILSKYLSSYAEAVNKYLPELGYIIVEFLNTESKRLA